MQSNISSVVILHAINTLYIKPMALLRFLYHQKKTATCNYLIMQFKKSVIKCADIKCEFKRLKEFVLYTITIGINLSVK